MLTQTPMPSDSFDALPLHDRVQIALAVADQPALRSLLTDCVPPIASPHRIGNISAKVGIPLESRKAIDGLIQFELFHCVLADSAAELEQSISEYTRRSHERLALLELTRCEAETRTLGQVSGLSQAIALLTEVGFSHQQIDEILNLPQDTWHKSWWFTVDAAGSFTVPFLRLMRARRYANGTYTLHYKDLFAEEKPACFKSQTEQVLVEISPAPHSFRKTIEKINYARQQIGVHKALLICDRLPDLEARGYISQGISLYTAAEIMLPAHANCAYCMTKACPMNGRADSPVVACQQFCLDCGV
ncbi:hypothetical protein IFO70_21965 [Phormidium tenue FACHB-886]|nr:hypothetical protein [Phormidium tenue FACHB-886]